MSDILRRLLPFAIILIVAFSGIYVLESVIFCPDENPDCVSLPSDLVLVTDEISNVTTLLNEETKAAANKLSVPGGKDLQAVLNDAYANTGYAVSYGFVTPEGIIDAVSPEKYSGSVGLDIGKTEPAKTILDAKTPVMTGAFMAQEGFSAVEISYPVFSLEGDYLGAVLCMAEPVEFLSDIISPVESRKGLSITVMQTDGYILYDKDPAQIGKNIFTDPFFLHYTGLVNLGHMISSKETGYGTYTFYDTSSESKKPVKKQAHWDTVKNPGQEWRVILFKTAVSYF